MRALSAGAAVLSMGLMISGCKEPPSPPPPVPSVVVTPAVTGSISPHSTEVGQVIAYDHVKLTARVRGFLVKKNFQEGQNVKEGSLLYLIEQAQYLAEVKAAQAELMMAQANQKNADINYSRQKELYQKDAVSQKAYDDATAKRIDCDAAALGAQARLEQAKLNLSYTEIKAPFDGRVGLANYSVGNLVGPDSGPLADIARIDPVRVQYNLNEVDLLELLRSKDTTNPDFLTVNLYFQDGRRYDLPGEITFWNNQINPTTGTLLMQATFPNPHSLLIPGMYVKVKVETKMALQAVMVPKNSIIEDQSGKYVLVVNASGSVEKRRIAPADYQNEEDATIGVQSGVRAGEMVIVDGLQKVRPGIKVTAVTLATGTPETAAAAQPPTVDAALLTSSSSSGAPTKSGRDKPAPALPEHKSSKR